MMATMADAHREWHLNTGIPMGTPGCPEDACHPIEDWEDEPGIKCGHCKQYHYTTREVFNCDVRLANRGHAERM